MQNVKERELKVPGGGAQVANFCDSFNCHQLVNEVFGVFFFFIFNRGLVRLWNCLGLHFSVIFWGHSED